MSSQPIPVQTDSHEPISNRPTATLPTALRSMSAQVSPIQAPTLSSQAFSSLQSAVSNTVDSVFSTQVPSLVTSIPSPSLSQTLETSSTNPFLSGSTGHPIASDTSGSRSILLSLPGPNLPSALSTAVGVTGTLTPNSLSIRSLDSRSSNTVSATRMSEPSSNLSSSFPNAVETTEASSSDTFSALPSISPSTIGNMPSFVPASNIPVETSVPLNSPAASSRTAALLSLLTDSPSETSTDLPVGVSAFTVATTFSQAQWVVTSVSNSPS
ncbi:hypothetical protein EJ08DRAFT_395849 [Tothia fuscella]|uniref:Uncharacterized protein n=1 Tax=Tothia fuscella TaxID=1048955 RepID=A0A9P4TVQ4_9PEZI|nr:hypothetical protein EJ08DRAFT_395849 [Tothia fuscella]